MDSMEMAGRAVAALLDGGVRHIVVAPGSRSAPLAYALAAAEAEGTVRLHVRIDERDAGFTALGLALVSGCPVAVVTTSGTAVGNLMPSVMEANHSAVPLIVVSADRPEELRGTGANQTTRQAGLFGTAVRYDVDVPAGADPAGSVATGIAAALGTGTSRLAGVRGPVQLNLAFRDPLTPVLEPGSAAKPSRQDGTEVSRGRTGQDELAALDFPDRREGVEQPNVSGDPGRAVESRDGSDRVALRTPGSEHRTVVVAGAGAGAGAELFASLLRLPLFADPTSNARHGANAVGPYRLLLEHLGQDIERVVLFGRPTLSRQVAALLARTDVETAFYEPEPVAWYESGRRRERPIATRDELAEFAGTGPAGWLASWQEAADRSEAALDSVLAREPVVTGLQVARSLWADTTRRNARLVVGSSNPIRDLDLAARPAERSWAGVFANRGIAGIDGTIATATGIALAEPERETRLLLGDLTLLHDVGGLFLGSGEASPNLQIIVLNDAGGGIFSLLEHGLLGESDQYRDSVERLFGTPHTVDISALAQAYGVRYRLAGTAVELEGALAERIRGRSIIEVRTERADLRNLHQRIKDAIRTAV
ncbi:2-succinyl-5-enolpyruvyl-6-hydroxy-3-cyclohexene-1-carboxylic-acid synthase [Arthrobacter sp. H14]|uniref:2-succinyl-5-enolpyruvyl-6-hydroxy-3- cyclohexene-1-carboxylic-acid synthase n=1 Tax=Arthrobacter sp. H14 TaxID=1312959 RepID=UPI0004B5783C|nr:2-succinyl-5-enolpyruvyl-6-hydroxy-3-cyclohexene-1-carboxylic-acid synthase [Arthrobacter sp. H14]